MAPTRTTSRGFIHWILPNAGPPVRRGCVRAGPTSGIDEHLRITGRRTGQLSFAGRRGVNSGPITRQFTRLVGEWIASIGLDPLKFGTHSLRRTKASGPSSVPGHTKIESTVRYFGVEIDDAIEIAEKIEV